MEKARLGYVLENIKNALILLPDLSNVETKIELETMCQKNSLQIDYTVDCIQAGINMLEIAQYRLEEKLK